MTRIATLVLALVVPLAAAQSQFAGKWQGATPSGSSVEMTGTLKVNDEEATVSDIKVKDKTLTFVGTRGDKPQPFTCELGAEDLRCWPDGRGPSGAAVLKRVAEKK
jgi:hypothetical protein